MWIHPKERSLNPRHVPGSQGESEDEAGSGAPGLTPCHGEHLIPVAGLSPPAPLQILPALVPTWPRASLGKQFGKNCWSVFTGLKELGMFSINIGKSSRVFHLGMGKYMIRISLYGRKVMTNLDSIVKSRDITLPTKVHLVKAMVFPVVMYGCESWTVKKAERRRINTFELWCWRRLLSATARLGSSENVPTEGGILGSLLQAVPVP